MDSHGGMYNYYAANDPDVSACWVGNPFGGFSLFPELRSGRLHLKRQPGLSAGKKLMAPNGLPTKLALTETSYDKTRASAAQVASFSVSVVCSPHIIPLSSIKKLLEQLLSLSGQHMLHVFVLLFFCYRPTGQLWLGARVKYNICCST